MITWSEIEIECGDYRAGFVAIFRKYEGQPTDEKDRRNRLVTVTERSFARHMGIPETTFHEWVKRTAAGHQPRQRDYAREAVGRMEPAEKAKLAAELIAEPDIAEQIVSQPETRRSINRATDVHDRREAQQRAQRTERVANQDQTGQRIDNLRWVTMLGEAAERWARDAGEALRHIDRLPGSEKYWLTGATDRAESAVRATRRLIELGQPEMDAELRHLVENGG